MITPPHCDAVQYVIIGVIDEHHFLRTGDNIIQKGERFIVSEGQKKSTQYNQQEKREQHRKNKQARKRMTVQKRFHRLHFLSGGNSQKIKTKTAIGSG